MLLIVGLGNPDKKYAGNRHNVGFQIIDAIADAYSFDAPRKKFNAEVFEGTLTGSGMREKTILLKPQTYYNESGRSVGEAMRFYKLSPEDVIVIHDELDLAPGKLKVKMGGGNAGNNGLKSISAHIGPEFYRVRIGIGHPGDKSKVTGFVLNDFSKQERADWVDEFITQCARHFHFFADKEQGSARFMSGVAHAMGGQKAAPKKQEDKLKQTTPQPDQKRGSPFDALRGFLGKDKD